MEKQGNLVLNWGIVSAGQISQDFCTSLASLNSNNHRVSAVAARNLQEAQKFSQTFKIPSFYGSYDELYADPNVNIIYVGSVNHTHREQCLKAITAGKHVLCEKPMSISQAEQDEVLSAAKEKNVFFMEGLWSRFFPVMEKITHELSDRSIGELKYFLGSYLLNIKDVERIKRKELGGGGILDLGIYPIQLACWVFNHEEPLKICASGHLMPSGVDESCSITLLFSGQRMAQINISTNCHRFDSAYLVGDKGIIEIPQHLWSPTEYIRADGQRVVVPLPECEKTNFQNAVALRFEAEQVRVAIEKGLTEHPFVTHCHSRLIMRIMEEAKNQLGYKS